MQIRPIPVQNGLGGAVGDDLAFFEPDDAGAKLFDDADVVRDQDHGLGLVEDVQDTGLGLLHKAVSVR